MATQSEKLTYNMERKLQLLAAGDRLTTGASSTNKTMNALKTRGYVDLEMVRSARFSLWLECWFLTDKGKAWIAAEKKK